MTALTVLIGGARAGKSALAAKLATKTALPVTYVATAEAWDDEMKDRIARHRAERPENWATVEEPVDMGLWSTPANIPAPTIELELSDPASSEAR